MSTATLTYEGDIAHARITLGNTTILAPVALKRLQAGDRFHLVKKPGRDNELHPVPLRDRHKRLLYVLPGGSYVTADGQRGEAA